MPRVGLPSRGIQAPPGVRRDTQAQLLRLVNGHRPTALRLVEQLQLRHPDRSEQWCWEKAIFDIERDRRRI